MNAQHPYPAPWLYLLLSLLLLLAPVAPAQASSGATGFMAPELVAPANGARTTGTTDPPNGTPTFAWNPVEGASTYQIQISTSAGFSQVIKEATTYATTYTPDMALADGTYYWRVRAGDGQMWGPFSNVRMFRKDWSAGGTLRPTPLSPTNHAVLTDFNQGFRWTPVPGTAYYLFEIDNSPNFTSVDYSAFTLKPAHTPTEKLGNDRYYWRVTPVDPQGHFGTPMPPSSFTLNWHFTPELLSPEPDAVLTFLVPFEWTAVPGAKTYVIQIDTDPNFTSPTEYTTLNTSFVPQEALSNDEDYYWRVQAVDNAGNSGPFSEVRRFRLRWDFAPQLLTPVKNWVSVSAPTFRWTPVPGAYQYEIQISESASFAPPLKADVNTFMTEYTHAGWGDLNVPGTYYWRVRALDAGGSPGPWSETYAFTFARAMAPEPLYPPHYYTIDESLTPIHTRADVPAPLFLWNTAHDEGEGDPSLPFPSADRYVLEVDDDPQFLSPNFRVETAALGAAPTDAQPFTDFAYNTPYYWRVRGYVGDTPLGYPIRWVAQFSPNAPGPAPTEHITLLSPADNTSWSVDAPPLAWAPVKGAQKYRLQISTTPDFGELYTDVTTSFTHFVPGQDRTEKLEPRTYWWRVRTETPLGAWSETRAFRITHRLMTGNPVDYAPPQPLHNDSTSINRILEDEISGRNAYDLDSLWVVQDRYYKSTELRWLLDLVTYARMGNSVEYAIYIDVDHAPDKGGTTDPRGRAITFPAKERPDVVLDLHLQPNGTIDPALIWTYTATGWGVPQDLYAAGAEITFNPGQQSIQIYLPYTALGGNDPRWDGALGFAVALFDTTGTVRDVMPGNSTESIPYFVYTSDLLNPILPLYLPRDVSFFYPTFPLLRWSMPYWDSVDGYRVEVARDKNFTDIAATWEAYEATVDYSPLYGFLATGYIPTVPLGDNETYYWRVQVRHEIYNEIANLFDYGPFSRPMRFAVRSLAPAHLQPENDALLYRTPVLRWDRVENAGRYRIQLDDDANFSSPIVDEKVDYTAYMDPETLGDQMGDGTYYWRVAVVRDDTQGPWSEVHTFVKISPSPQPESPEEGAVIHELPTLHWRQVFTPTTHPRLSSPLYQVELADNPNFSEAMTFVTDATSFTPPKDSPLPDGTWYWRVAMLRDATTMGPYSQTRSFYKEYPAPHVSSPPDNARVTGPPAFQWDPIPGAASYKVEISQDANFSLPLTYRTDNTRFTPTDEMAPGTWYWRVQMLDAEDQPGPFTQGKVYVGYSYALPYIP